MNEKNIIKEYELENPATTTPKSTQHRLASLETTIQLQSEELNGLKKIILILYVIILFQCIQSMNL